MRNWTKAETREPEGTVVKPPLALTFCLAVLLGACMPSEPSEPRTGSMCRTSRGDGLWGGSAEPAVDEGGGLVSVVTSSFTDTGDGDWSISVTDCASGKGTRLRVKYGELENLDKWYGPGVFEPKDARFSGTEEEDVLVLRKAGYLADLERLRTIAPVAGYLPTVTKASAESDHTICACKLYYPNAMGDWAARQKSDAAASN